MRTLQPDEQTLGRLRQAVVDGRDDLIKLASDLIAFPTVSPPGRNTADAQNYVSTFLALIGFEIDRFDVYPNDPDVVGRLPGSLSATCSSLMFNGHIDVADVEPVSAWNGSPFEPRVDQGRLVGRGAADMKGPLAAALHAIRTIRHLDIPLGGDLLFESVIGEEQGEAGTLSCVERGYLADFAIVPEPTNLVIAGQGGVITGWIEVQSPETLHDGVRARTIHAGGGLFGASAIEKMVKILQGLQELERHWAVTKQYRGFAPGSTTINPAVIEGGRHPAFIADRCALWITVHFYPDETSQEVTAEIEEHLLRVAASDLWLRAHPPRFRWGGRSMIDDRGEIFPPVPYPAAHPGVQELALAHRKTIGAEAERVMWPSVSDAGWLASAGIPTVIYGPGQLEQAHTINESVEIDELMQAAQVYAELIVRWCNRPRVSGST